MIKQDILKIVLFTIGIVLIIVSSGFYAGYKIGLSKADNLFYSTISDFKKLDFGDGVYINIEYPKDGYKVKYIFSLVGREKKTLENSVKIGGKND